MSVAFLTNDFVKYPGGIEVPGGCCYYRCSLPMFACGLPARLGRPAFHPTYGFGVKESDQRAVFRFDTVVLKLLMSRWTQRQMLISQQLGQRIIVDVDDAYEFIPEVNWAHRLTDPELNKTTNRDHYKAVIEQADTVTVSTPFLLEHHSKTHSDVRLVRNGVYPGMFPVKRHRDMTPTIGWVGSIPFRGEDLETLDWLEGFLVGNGLRFHHSGEEQVDGVPKFHEKVGIDPGLVSSCPTVAIDLYPTLFQHFDIGIVPLADIPFNYAKSCIKGLEYAAAGIPFVAAATPEYQRLADMGVGRVASTPDEWVKHLTELLDYRTRRREAAENRRLVERDHSIHAREAEWQAVFG